MAVNLLALATVNRLKIYQGQPTTTAVTMYTCPALTDVKIMSIVICNTTGSDATIQLNVRTSAAGVANRVLSDFVVKANDTVTIDTPIMMTAGDIISGLQGTNAALTVTISGETYA